MIAHKRLNGHRFASALASAQAVRLKRIILFLETGGGNEQDAKSAAST
jgi:hypothetical protein